jgi:hypothetical protein
MINFLLQHTKINIRSPGRDSNLRLVKLKFYNF